MDSNTALEIDKLRNNPNSRIIIVMPGAPGQAGAVVLGYVVSDFGFGLAASWGGLDLVTSAQRQVNRFMNLGLFGISQMGDWLKKIGINSPPAMPQRLFMSLLQTISSYEGTEKPTLILPLIFIATKPDDDVRIEAFKLLQGVTPIWEDSWRLKAPLGYAFSLNAEQLAKEKEASTSGQQTYTSQQEYVQRSNIIGTVSFSIGQWFQLDRLVIKSVEPVFSKEVTPLGWPLYCRVNVAFEPVLMWTIDDIRNMFSGMNWTSNTTTNEYSEPDYTEPSYTGV
jgi:hypothetical protein